ncbi:MAG: hypothetical protein J5927_04995 [Oscillospiraceae bacterium]|nr:hypothetical protein [Oscillospiraceae bacterium]
MAIKIYGTTQCPDTRDCLAFCEAKAVPYVFLDITRLPVLKEFLTIRDRSPLFDAVRTAGGVGIPLIQKDDGSCTLDWESAVGK